MVNPLSEEEQNYRRYAIQQAVGSARLEGLIVSKQALSLMEANMLEQITDEEMVGKMKAIYTASSFEHYNQLAAVSKDPYLLANGTMKNKFGIIDAEKMQQAECDLVAMRTYQLIKSKGAVLKKRDHNKL